MTGRGAGDVPLSCAGGDGSRGAGAEPNGGVGVAMSVGPGDRVRKGPYSAGPERQLATSAASQSSGPSGVLL